MKYSVLFLFAALIAASISCKSPDTLSGVPVDYRSDEVTLKGYLVYDKAVEGKRPGVLVVHEWWGHNDYVRERARQLAKLGYTALAVDMYGDGRQADHPKDAMKFSSEVMKNISSAEKRFRAALEVLKNNETVDTSKIAAIGYCFGGGVVLNMARRGIDLKGVVSFHGSLAAIAPARKGAVKAKILVCHGADDTFVSPEQIDAFKQEMEKAGVDYRFVSYEGAIHAFSNPAADELGKKFNIPLAFNADADRKSWNDMKDFFETIFK